MSQLTLTMEFSAVHRRENNESSQTHLEQYSNLFNQSCWFVLKALVSGHILTTDNAKEIAGTRSLPRRLKDLKDTYGFTISERHIGACKEWFMTDEDKAKAMEIIVSKIKSA